jgi:hypothetical protein
VRLNNASAQTGYLLPDDPYAALPDAVSSSLRRAFGPLAAGSRARWPHPTAESDGSDGIAPQELHRRPDSRPSLEAITAKDITSWLCRIGVQSSSYFEYFLYGHLILATNTTPAERGPACLQDCLNMFPNLSSITSMAVCTK